MNHLEFFKAIKSDIFPSYVFMGKEEFVKEKAEKDLIEAVLKGGDKSFNLQILGEDATLSRVNDALNTMPLMCERRMVIWNNPKQLSGAMSDDDLSFLEEIASANIKTACLLIYIKGSLEKNRKTYKLLNKKSCVVEFNPLTEADAVKWLINAAKRNKKEITAGAATEIVGAVGVSVMDLNNELEKLCSHLGDRTKLEKADLKVLSEGNINYDTFEMINCFLKGNTQKGMSQMYRLIENGASGFGVMGAVASKMRMYYNAKIMLKSGKNKQEVINALGNGYSAKCAVNECASMSLDKIKKGIDALEYADYAIKNGRMSEKTAVEYVITTAFMEA